MWICSFDVIESSGFQVPNQWTCISPDAIFASNYSQGTPELYYHNQYNCHCDTIVDPDSRFARQGSVRNQLRLFNIPEIEVSHSIHQVQTTYESILGPLVAKGKQTTG